MQEISVVKIGGTEGVDITMICEEIAALSKNGKQFIVVHGGSKDANQLGKALGSPPKFITSPSGFTSRYTDEKTLDVFTMALKGRVNVKIVSALQKAGANAFGLSGFDGRLIEAERKKKVFSIEHGKRKIIRDDHSGKIGQVNPSILFWLLENDFLPVIAPLAISEEGGPLNIDADRVAAEIAGAVQAKDLYLFTAVKGLMKSFPDESTWIPKIKLAEIDAALDFAEGRMKKKVHAAKEALVKGVSAVAIADGRVQNPIQNALDGNASWIGG